MAGVSLVFVTDADENELENILQGLRVEVIFPTHMKSRGDLWFQAPSEYNQYIYNNLPEEDPLAHWRGVQLDHRLLGIDVPQLGGLAGHLPLLLQLLLGHGLNLGLVPPPLQVGRGGGATVARGEPGMKCN